MPIVPIAIGIGTIGTGLFNTIHLPNVYQIVSLKKETP